MNNIGRVIKARRELLGYTQQELAKKLGYKSKSSINKIESGVNDIPHSKLVAIANALLCTPEYLIDSSNSDFQFFSEYGIYNIRETTTRLLKSYGFRVVRGSKMEDEVVPHVKLKRDQWYIAIIDEGTVFEVAASELNDFQKGLASYARFQMSEVIKNSQKIEDVQYCGITSNPDFQPDNELMSVLDDQSENDAPDATTTEDTEKE